MNLTREELNNMWEDFYNMPSENTKLENILSVIGIIPTILLILFIVYSNICLHFNNNLLFNITINNLNLICSIGTLISIIIAFHCWFVLPKKYCYGFKKLSRLLYLKDISKKFHFIESYENAHKKDKKYAQYKDELDKLFP